MSRPDDRSSSPVAGDRQPDLIFIVPVTEGGEKGLIEVTVHGGLAAPLNTIQHAADCAVKSSDIDPLMRGLLFDDLGEDCGA